MKRFLILVLALALLCPAALAEDFIFGMDVSSVLSLEAAGVKYYDYDGYERDLFEILAENGVNYILVWDCALAC